MWSCLRANEPGCPGMANKAVINLEDGWSDMEVGAVCLLCNSWLWQGCPCARPEHMVCDLDLLAGCHLAQEGALLLLNLPAALAVLCTAAPTLLQATLPATAWHSKAEAHSGGGGRKQLRCRDVHAALHVSCLVMHADVQGALDSARPGCRPGCRASPGMASQAEQLMRNPDSTATARPRAPELSQC